MRDEAGRSGADGGNLSEGGAARPTRPGEAMDGNLFAALPTGPVGEELFEQLLARPGLCIERIVSTGQMTPPDSWYDQEQAEWVVLLSGAAELRFADESAPRRLSAGDWLHIAAHRRHRVEWTDPAQPSVWLAIHFQP